jgi:hypothetical protein
LSDARRPVKNQFCDLLILGCAGVECIKLVLYLHVMCLRIAKYRQTNRIDT